MPVWAWVLVGLFGALLMLVVVFFVWAMRWTNRVTADILDRGDDAAAWVVDVQPAEGLIGPTALVLVSPELDIPDDAMRQLVARLQELRTRRRKPATRDEREAVRLTAKEIDTPGRQRLPDGFTDGREVYSTFMTLGPDETDNLPKGALDDEWFPVRVIWDEYPTMMAVPPRRRKKKARRNDD